MCIKRCVAVCAVILFITAITPFCVKADDLSVSARCAVLYEPVSGTVLYEKNAHEVRSMASTTKLMTALVGIEQLGETQTVTVSPQAVRTEGSSLGLCAGDTLAARDLITGMLLASGNDAANAVALAVSPTVESFAVRMNQRARELGMNNTHFITPSGLDADGHASTAYDMALLGAAVLQHPTLAVICRMKTAQIPIVSPQRTLYVKNHNRLLSLYSDVVGLKTGFTKQSGRCLVSAAVRNGVTLIAVTLNAPDDWNDHIALFDYGFGQTERVTWPSVDLPSLAVTGGTQSTVSLTAPQPKAWVRVRSDSRVCTAVLELPPFVFAPIRQGDMMGTVRYFCGEQEVQSVPVTAAHDVPKTAPLSFFVRLWRNLCLLFSG